MSDPPDIICIRSSPPRSPLFDLPTTSKKVSDMCMDADELDNSSSSTEDVQRLNLSPYHTISDSDDESAKSNCIRPVNVSPPDIAAFGSSLSDSPKKKLNVSEKRALKELKALERAKKLKEKQERAVMLEKIRQSKPGQCIKNITVILDVNIINSYIGKKAVELFKDVEFQFTVETQKDQFSVTWTRKEPGLISTVTEEKHILFLWSFDKIVTSIKYCTFLDTFREFIKKYANYRIYLGIYGRGDYYKSIGRNNDVASNKGDGASIRKKRRTIDLTQDQIDMALTELEVLLKISTRFLKNFHELSNFLQQITKAIAETPHRKEVEKRDMEKCWYARGDSRNCVKIDKDFNGLHRLWLQQLTEFSKSSLDIAKSIVELYPSPFALYEAYKNLDTQREKDLLLQDIKIKRGSSNRRIGPELSRKICLLFSQENGEIYLSQE